MRFSILPPSFVSCLCVFTEDDQLSEPDYVSHEECGTCLFVLFDTSKQLFGSPSRTMNCMRIRTRSMTTAMSLPPAKGSSPQPHLLPSPGGSISVNNAVATSLYNSQPQSACTTLSASTTHHFNSHCVFLHSLLGRFFTLSCTVILHLHTHTC